MVYLPPFWVSGTHQLNSEAIQHFAEQYKLLLIKISDDQFTNQQMLAASVLNDLVATI